MQSYSVNYKALQKATRFKLWFNDVKSLYFNKMLRNAQRFLTSSIFFQLGECFYAKSHSILYAICYKLSLI